MSRLQTNAIRHLTSAADNLTMDSAGRVLTPNNPAFLATYATGKVKVAGWNLLPAFDATDYNIGNHFSGQVFTAPVAGLYLFTAGGFIPTGTAGADTRVAVMLQKNGVDYHIGGAQLSSSDTPFPNNTFLARAAANDQFRLSMFSPADVTLGSGASYSFVFAGCLIG